MPGRLVRLRVDPKKIVVSIRPTTAVEWSNVRRCLARRMLVRIFTIMDDGSRRLETTGNGVELDVVIERALRRLEQRNVDGIDPLCQWAYEHSWLDPT
jgi:hypothetical protein